MLKLEKSNAKTVKVRCLKPGDTFAYGGHGFIVTNGDHGRNCMHLTESPGSLCKFFGDDCVTPMDYAIRALDV